MKFYLLVAEPVLLEGLKNGVLRVKSIDEDVKELEKMFAELVQNKKLIVKET